MKFITKRDHGKGWYLVRPPVDGARYEVTVYDGVHFHMQITRPHRKTEVKE